MESDIPVYHSELPNLMSLLPEDAMSWDSDMAMVGADMVKLLANDDDFHLQE